MATVKKTADTATLNTAFETLAQPLQAAQEQVRTIAEKGIEQARTQYATIKKAAEDATGTLEASFGTFNNSIAAFNTKALDVLRTNANAAFDHFAALQGVKSFPEAIELQTAHARKQFEAAGAQIKELAALAQKTANDVVEPVKQAIAKR